MDVTSRDLKGDPDVAAGDHGPWLYVSKRPLPQCKEPMGNRWEIASENFRAWFIERPDRWVRRKNNDWLDLPSCEFLRWSAFGVPLINHDAVEAIKTGYSRFFCSWNHGSCFKQKHMGVVSQHHQKSVQESFNHLLRLSATSMVLGAQFQSHFVRPFSSTVDEHCHGCHRAGPWNQRPEMAIPCNTNNGHFIYFAGEHLGVFN